MKTAYDMAIWRNKEAAVTHAYPLGFKDAGGDTVFPVLDDKTWDYKGTMPRGCPVTELVTIKGNMVKCKLNGGETVTTVRSAIDE